MAHTISLSLPHTSSTTLIVTTLFTSLRNAPQIRAHLLASNADYDYAFIDASSILSTTHVLAAVERAVRDWNRGRGKSRNVHSEVVFALGGSNNISDALRRFGLTDKTTALLAIRIIDTTLPPYSPTNPSSSTSQDPAKPPPPTQPRHNTLESIKTFLGEAIQGTSVAFCDEEIAKVRNIASIRKAYKLPAPSITGVGKKPTKGEQINGAGAGVGDGEKERKQKEEQEDGELRELEINILGIMAIKGS